MKLAAPSSLALNDPAALVGAPESMAFAVLVDRVRTTIETWNERRQLAAARRDFAKLGPGMLRDLAIAPGEFESYWAEAQGRAQSTRRRVR